MQDSQTGKRKRLLRTYVQCLGESTRNPPFYAAIGWSCLTLRSCRGSRILGPLGILVRSGLGRDVFIEACLASRACTLVKFIRSVPTCSLATTLYMISFAQFSWSTTRYVQCPAESLRDSAAQGSAHMQAAANLCTPWLAECS